MKKIRSTLLSVLIANLSICNVLAGKLINVPYINQEEIHSGCEAVSSTMLLMYYGYTILAENFTNDYLIKKCWYTSEEDSQVYGPDPNSAYPGDPYIAQGENCGYGSYAPSTAKSIEKILDSSKHKTKVTTGMSLNDLKSNYIDNDNPVLIWVTMDMKASKPGDSWIINYVDENSPYRIGDKFTWTASEHCVVFVGYDDEGNVLLNDPYKNHGTIAYSEELVNQRFLELGKQSVAILTIQPEEPESVLNE